MTMPSGSKPRHSHILSLWLGYLFLVFYGSLVPLDFKPLSLNQAWFFFQHMPMFGFEEATRTDWISNAVLAIPTGFLTAHLLLEVFPQTQRAFILFIASLFSFAFVVSVEFTQIFFPPRTCSLNDIFSQSIGGLIGLLLAAKYSVWFKTLLHALFCNPRLLAFRLAEAYLVGYVAFCLFPFDILLSSAELEQKVQGDNWGWLLAAIDLQGSIHTVLKLLSEVILTLPFGIYLGYRRSKKIFNYKHAAVLGLLLGGSIEIAQFFIASGISEGISVLTRAAAICGGLALWQRRANWSPERLETVTKRYALPIGVLYLMALLHENGWFSHPWNGTDYAVTQLDNLHFMPFYYHYFTTEANALFSVAFVCLMYLPFGLFTWVYRGSPGQAFFYALIGASIVEVGKLFLQDMHPDPTNLALGALASWGMVHLAKMIFEEAAAPAISAILGSQNSKLPNGTQNFGLYPPKKTVANAEDGTIRGCSNAISPTLLLSLASLTFAAYWAATFPTQPVLLCIFLSVCAAAIWYRPLLLVAIIPAALPVLDLAPWSGRFYLDEFDLLLIISLAIGYVRIPAGARSKRHTDTLFTSAIGLVAISFVISTLLGLFPWQFPDANAFTNYYSSFNAIRIGKGAFWALLCYELLRRLLAAGMDIQRPLAMGMVTGLALTVAVILWERLTFSGLFNFVSDYRVTGPFSAMHTGGAYIECFLALAMPFLILLVLETRNWLVRLPGVGLLLAATYAVMVTFSRNGYMAFGVSAAIILFFATFKSGRWQQKSIIVVALSGAMFAVAMPVFTGQFAQDRMATIAKDLAVRQAHWQDALNIRTPGLLTTVFGVGLGRYPEAHYLFSAEGNRSATYQLMHEAENPFLRLVSGDSIYVGQRVSVVPRQKYFLSLDARTNKPDSTITIPICEKWLLSSYNCMWSSFVFGKETGIWRHFEVQLSADEMSISHWFSQRPIKLALYNGNANTIIDVDNVRLETSQGENLLRNGNFSNELDYWLFTADSHLQWHVKSLPVALLFDQGWFGLIALGLFASLAIMRAASHAWRGNLSAAAVLASFSGFLVVGLFDTLIDAPRFLLLLLLLGWFCGFRRITDPKGVTNA